LLPDEATSRRMVEFARTLPPNGLIELGEAALPHVTVAQFIAAATELENLWEVVKPVSKTLSLTSAGISFVPDNTRNQTWAEIQFLKSADLQHLQDVICQSDFAERFKIWSG